MGDHRNLRRSVSPGGSAGGGRGGTIDLRGLGLGKGKRERPDLHNFRGWTKKEQVVLQLLLTFWEANYSNFIRFSRRFIWGTSTGGLFLTYKHALTSSDGLYFSQVTSSSKGRNTQTAVVVSGEALPGCNRSKWVVKLNKPA